MMDSDGCFWLFLCVFYHFLPFFYHISTTRGRKFSTPDAKVHSFTLFYIDLQTKPH